MKFFLFLPCFFVLLGYAHPAVESEPSTRITSFLLELRIEEAKAVYESERFGLDSLAQNEYRELFDRLSPAAIPSDTAQLRSVGAMAAQMEERFRTPVAGRSANSAYRKCIESYFQSDLKSSVLFYRLALFFKTRYIIEERLRLRTSYYTLRQIYAEENYPAAKSFVDSLITAETGNPTFGELKDSLRNIRTSIENRISEINSEQRKYASDEIFGYTVGLSLGIAPMYTTTLHDVRWILKTSGDGVLFSANVGSIHPSYGYSAIAQLRYHYSPVLSQLLRYETGGVTTTAVDMEGQRTTISLKHTMTAYSTLLRYYFSEKTGLRGFISLGGGSFSLQREEQTIYIADFLIGASRIKNYSLLSDKMSSTKLTGEWGLEYSTGSLSRFYIEGSLGVHYLSAQQKMISPLFVTIQFIAGWLM